MAVSTEQEASLRRVHDAAGHLRRRLVFVLAAASGLAVSGIYYAQPLLPAMGHTMRLGPGATGLIVTLSQLGFALGLVFVLPLGDLLNRRRLCATLAAALAAFLVVFGLAVDAPMLFVAALLVGSASVLAQLVVPFAASLAADDERGKVVGTVMSGLLIGILLARTFAGVLAAAGSWRTVYLVAAAAMAIESAILARSLPDWRLAHQLTYPGLLRSVAALVRDEPTLRLRALFGFLGFGSFSVLWTSMAFLLAHRYHYSTIVIGLFGLIGAAGALTASLAGRLSDAGHGSRSTGLATALLLASWIAIWGGSHSIWWLIVGIAALDVGAQGLHITNQGEIYRLDPAARSRLTAAYMVTFFLGGSLGSLLSANLYSADGWNGVSIVGAAFAAVAFAVFAAGALWRGRRTRRRWPQTRAGRPPAR